MTGRRPQEPAPTGAAPHHGPRAVADGVLARLRAAWARTPLLARLVGISMTLLALGLAIAGTATTTLLNQYLVGQADQRLTDEAASLTEYVIKHGDVSGLPEESWKPSEYSVLLTVQGYEVPSLSSAGTIDRYGTPQLESVSEDEAVARRGQPFTVRSDVRGSAWRAVIVPVTAGEDGPVVGSATVALPLGDVQGTVRRAAVLLWSSALAILVIGVVVGTWAVQRSLRPLREIEETAATIAAGDLSRRVPTAPETTEVGRLGAALNGMLAQIETAFDARTASEERMRRFVADASHELRTPLAAIRGYGELYRMGALTQQDQVDDTMRRIEQSATRMGGLVEDLLALARLDADRATRAEPVDLAVLATDAAHDLRAIDPTREVHVGALPDGPAPPPGPARGPSPAARAAAPAGDPDPDADAPTVVRGDEARLRQVLANLVGNVARHTPAGSPVEVLVGRRGDHVVVEVRDHGPGIPPEHAGRVFERFYRIDASRTRDGGGSGGGAGLGMAIVAAIVAAHHGDVQIAQTDGGGATVRVSLPVAGPAAPQAEREATGA